MARILPDITPLRVSREFRLLIAGQFVSLTGSALRTVAIAYQVYVLTQSSFAVGLLGLFSAVPLMALSVWGGVIADRVDRRRMLLVTNACLAAVSLTLASTTQTGVASVPLLYALTAIGSSFSALDQPARAALTPTLVERRLIPAAIALRQTQIQVASVVGPAIAGVLIARLGIAAGYWIDALTFAVSFVTIFAMRVPPRDKTVVHAAPLRALADGLAFLRSRPLILATMSVDFFATFFAVSRAVMPYFADQVFRVGPEGLGLLFAAPGFGAAIVAVTSGWTTGVQRKGLGVLLAVIVFGLAIAAFGLLPASAFPVALLLLAVSEGADAVSAIFRHTIILLETPDELRGRLVAINSVFVSGGPQLGEVESGTIAALWSPEAAVITGGLACLGVVLVANTLVPQIARYRANLELEPAAT